MVGFHPLKRYETCADILSDAKCFSYMLKYKTFCTDHSRLRDFIILRNVHERKRLGETIISQGQSYDVTG